MPPEMRFVSVMSLLVSVLGRGISGTLAQEVITICGASAGHTYFVDRARDRKGWEEDGISRGTITFMRDAFGGYDIIIKDAATTFSAKQDGARVVKIDNSEDPSLTLVAAYPVG